MAQDVFTNTGSDTWYNPGVSEVEVLVVGGGGGGGGSDRVGGGGAGGIIFTQNKSVSGDQSVYVGAGGAGEDTNTQMQGYNGEDSTFGNLTAVGGGGGGSSSNDSTSTEQSTRSSSPRGRHGGSGGGAGNGRTYNDNVETIIPGGNGNGSQGNPGGVSEYDGTEYHGAGGGGYSQSGQDSTGTDPPGDGGDGGDFSATFGTAYGENGVFGGGGGGGLYETGATLATGGAGGGGGTNESALANTGGGGGGALRKSGGDIKEPSGDGGSGIVIVKYDETPATPTAADSTYVADDQVDFSWGVDTSGGAINSFDVEILRDGDSWQVPTGGPSSVSHDGSASYSKSYGPNSDNSYGSQVGIDSSFRFRVRAVGAGGTSGWDYSDTVYTTPIPPHNPSVSRPDANTFDISWTVKTSIAKYGQIEVREDTGSGYGTWQTVAFTVDLGANYSTGDTVNWTLNVGTDYGRDIVLKDDARYQFRVHEINNNQNYVTSEWVYADYGNSGNVYFEDDFEDQDLSEWSQTTLNDADSGIQSGSVTDLGISGADQGTYYLRLDGGDSASKNLPDLSSESDVIVRVAVATGSMDSGSEIGRIEWYHNGSWEYNEVQFGHEYNKQGWVEVSFAVPDSWLASDNKVRFRGYGGGGDLFAVGRVVVSDILHEYTKPAAPTNPSVDNSVADELTFSWTSNATFYYTGYPRWRKTGASSWNTPGWTSANPFTKSALDDGIEYEFWVEEVVQQDRNGERGSRWWHSEHLYSDPATTKILAPSTPTLDSKTANSASISWTNNDAAGNAQRRVYARRTGDESGDVRTGMLIKNTNNEHISVGPVSTSDVYSISFWATFDDSSWRGAQSGFGTGGGNTNDLYWWGTDNDQFGLNTWNADSYGIDNASFLREGWHHIVGIIHRSDYQSFRLFIDGDEYTTSQVRDTSSNVDFANNFGIGYNGWETSSQTHNGGTANLALYNRGLTASDVGNLNAGDIPRSDLIGYWPLDLIQSGTTPDLSPYSNDGTVNGPTLTGPTLQDKTGLVSNATSSATLSNLLNGEEYEAFVHAIADDNEVRNL